MDGDSGGVEMLRAEEHEADPAQVKQPHLSLVSWPQYPSLIGSEDEYCGKVSCDWSTAEADL